MGLIVCCLFSDSKMNKTYFDEYDDEDEDDEYQYDGRDKNDEGKLLALFCAFLKPPHLKLLINTVLWAFFIIRHRRCVGNGHDRQ